MVACWRDLNSLGTVELRALADDLEDSDVGGIFSRTSFTMSAGDLNIKGGSGEKESFLKDILLLGGL